jgi:oligopeptidase B
MKKLLIPIMMIFAACSSENTNQNKSTMNNAKPPVAEKTPHNLVQNGQTRVDNYYWLNDREDPEVIAYLTAENDYTEAMMKHTEGLQEKLFNEMKGRIKETDESVPYFYNGYYYYTRYEEGKEYEIVCRKKQTLEATEEVMLNGNVLSEGKSFFDIGDYSVSPDNKLLAFSTDTLGRRNYNIRIKNLETGEVMEDNIPVTTGTVVWANDNATLFYELKDDALRSYKIMKHKLGNNASDDELVFHEKDETFGVYVGKSKSNKYLFIASWSTLTTEMQFLDADKPNNKFKVIQPRTKDLEYSVSHYGDHFYIKTNFDAKNFRLMKTPVENPGINNWIEVIPNRDDVLLESTELFKDYLVVQEKELGLNKMRIIAWDGTKDEYIQFNDPAYSVFISTNAEFDTKILRYTYNSLTTPRSTYDYNMSDDSQILMKQQEVVGGYNPADYQSERVMVVARDGKKIPMSIVYKMGIKKDGNNPTLIYAYGSYGSSIPPYFSSARLSLLDRGFVYAIAHIRGSQTLGRQWYEDGKLLKKKNTFYDFVDCSKYLIDTEFTNADKLFAMGGSAGGLLMGAIYNLSPETYKGVVAQVPFVDIVTTMLDESIPLTTGEWDEWGNPKDSVYYEYMLSYSPYDNVEVKAYPAMLVTTGLHDSQVQYWEPAKWVAKLRDMKTDNNLLILKTNMDAGHGGASGRFASLKEVALEYAFILDQAGIDK